MLMPNRLVASGRPDNFHIQPRTRSARIGNPL